MINLPTAKYHKNIVLYFLGALVLINRFLILKQFGFQYTGNDDLIFWQAAFDYSQGIFHEPFFYGQDYNFALESILAVPLISIGIPFSIAMPLVSSIIAVFPFFFFSIVLFRRGNTISSYLFLLILLTLPIEYDIITSATRGFTSGLFFTSFLIFPLLSPSKISSFIILGLAVSLGYIFNANSLVFSFPICLYLLFKNYRKPAFYLIGIGATIPAFIIKYFSEQFYVSHPDYLVHPMWPLSYSFDVMMEGISHLDKFFRYLTPVYWGGHWVVLLGVLLLAILVIRKDWKKGLSLLLTVVFIIVLLGVNKINDDIGVIFLSSTRMFLALPLLLGLALFWTKKEFLQDNQWRLIIITVAISVFLVKISSYSPVLKEHTQETNYGPVAIKNLDDLTAECSMLEKITTENKVDLVVFIVNWEFNVSTMTFYNYGCSFLEENVSPSVLNLYEKRTWVFQREKDSVRENVLLFNQSLEDIEAYKKVVDCEVIEGYPNMVLIRNNDKTLLALSKIFDFPFKRVNY